MYIFRHHTADDLIDLDDRTGNWVSVEERDDDTLMVGLMTMAQRADYVIRGSYTIENDKRCSFYWNDDRELVFRPPDNRRLVLMRREAGARLVDLMPAMTVQLQPATHGDGRAMPGMSTFRLSDDGGVVLFEQTYDSERYLQFYLGNFTFAPDEDLSDWDFFVFVKRSLEELKKIALASAPLTAPKPPGAGAIDELVVADTGAACPRAGLWVPSNRLDVRRKLALGEAMPDVDGRAETWVWVGVEA